MNVSESDPPVRLARAPGRANLIGEHTDYNDGYVLPVALDLATEVHGRRTDGVVRLDSDGYEGTVVVDPATGAGPTEGWGRHVTAVVRALLASGHAIGGIDGAVHSDVPAGTGVSSSASFEVALALALLRKPIDALALARACQRAENEGIGVASGIMDPLVIAAAAPRSALFIDCRTLVTEPVPVPDDLAILVVDSGQRRELAGGEYNRRRAECEEAAHGLGVPSLRDANLAQVEAASLPSPVRERARHVVTENDRVLAARSALASGDRAELRTLLAASHASLRDDFAVSTKELDLLVEIAEAQDGVVGARMTGAGFGGCIVALVERERAGGAGERTVAAYERRSGREGRFWVSAPAAGALFEA